MSAEPVTPATPPTPPSNSPFERPVPPAQRAANETARTDVAKAPQRTGSPSASELAKLSPNERWARGQRAPDAGRVLVRNDRGEPQWKDEIAADRAPGSEAATDQPPADDAPKFKVGELELSEQQARDLLARDATEKSRALTLPADPSGYKLELPKNFVQPQGVEFQWATDDPVLGPMIDQAKTFAHKAGLSQEQFTDMMALHASTKVHEMAHFASLRRAEVDKLGATGTQRKTTIDTWLDASFDKETARMFKSTCVSKAQVEGWERIMSKLSGQGAGGYSPQHRESEPVGLSDEQWNGMSYSERRDYSERASAGRK